MAKPKGGLTTWFKENWVDISRKRKVVNTHLVVVKKRGQQEEDIPSVYLSE